MHKLLLSASLVLFLSACMFFGKPPLDRLRDVEVAYREAVIVSTTLRNSGLIGDEAWDTMKDLERKAFSALEAYRIDPFNEEIEKIFNTTWSVYLNFRQENSRGQ